MGRERRRTSALASTRQPVAAERDGNSSSGVLPIRSSALEATLSSRRGRRR